MRLQLPAHRRDVFARPRRRVHPTLDRRVLRRQPERIPAHRVQHVEALRPLEAGDDVAEGVVANMAHVNAPGRVREHFKNIVLAAVTRPRARRSSLPLLPDRLPLQLRSCGNRSGTCRYSCRSALRLARRNRRYAAIPTQREPPPHYCCCESVSKRSCRARVRIASSILAFGLRAAPRHPATRRCVPAPDGRPKRGHRRPAAQRPRI